MMDGIKIILCPIMVNAIYAKNKIKRFIAFAVVSMMKDFVRNAIKNLKIEVYALYVKSVYDTHVNIYFLGIIPLWKIQQMSNC